MLPIEFISEKGLKREINEDSVRYLSIGNYTVLMVADGIGGLDLGEEASRIAVDKAVACLSESLVSDDLSDADMDTVLKNLFNDINKDIYKNMLSKNSTKGSGSTLTLVIINGLKVVVAHIGDSRAYMIHGSSIIKLTEDHVAESGSHMLTKSLGENVFVNPDIYRYSIMYGDLVLVCTDGIHSVLSNDEILVCLKKHKDLKGCLNNLIDAVNIKGAPDNFTAVLAHNKLVR